MKIVLACSWASWNRMKTESKTDQNAEFGYVYMHVHVDKE